MCIHQKTELEMEQKLIELKGKIDKSTVIVGDFNIPFSTNREKMNKDIKEVNDTINQ